MRREVNRLEAKAESEKAESVKQLPRFVSTFRFSP
jgi:hypothetical protein